MLICPAIPISSYFQVTLPSALANVSDIKLLHGPSMFAVKAKIYGVLYNQASSIAFDETSTYWSALKSS